MLTEDYVDFETAKLLKEKGFDAPCMGRYSVRSKEFHLDCTKMCNNGGLFECAAPSHAMAMKWLREVHNIVIGVNVLNENNKGNTDYSNPDRWWYFWEFTDTKGVYKEELQPDPLSNEYSTYEEAAEAAIKYCLENLI